MTIGERIKLRRDALGMTQDELSKKLGYKSRSSINKIEKESRNLTQQKILDIANALDTTPGYIMGWEENADVVQVAMSNAKTRSQLIAYAKFLVNQMENEDI